MKFESNQLKKQEDYLNYRAKERTLKTMQECEKRLSEKETYSEINDILQDVDGIISIEQEKKAEQPETEGLENNEQMQDVLTEEMEDIEEDIGKDELRQLGKESQKRLSDFLYKKLVPLKRAQRKLSEKIPQLIQETYSDKKLRENPLIWDKITKIEEKASEIGDSIDKISNQSPEAFLANGLLKLRKNKRDFDEYCLIETPEIKKIHAEIMNNVRKKLEGRNGVITLTGGTGIGKTVLARK